MSVPTTFVGGTDILSSEMNDQFSDIASELTNSLALDGQSTMTGQIKAAAGVLATPSISFGADTDTGFYRKSANVIGVVAGGAEVGTISASGISGIHDPAGAVIAYAGSAAPTGWLLCYGQAVSRATYPSLFTAIGEVYGAGDAITTFNLPDARGRGIFGKDNMGGSTASRITNAGSSIVGTTLGATGGVQSVTLTTAQIPSHSHTGTTGAGGAHNHTGTTAETGTDHTHDGTTASGGSHDHGAATGSDGAHSHTVTGTVTTTSEIGGGGALGVIVGSGATTATGVGNNFYNTSTYGTITNTSTFSSGTTNSTGAHTHTIASHTGHTHTFTTGGISLNHTHTFSTSTSADHTHTFTTATSGGDTAHSNMPPALILNLIIRAY